MTKAFTPTDMERAIVSGQLPWLKVQRFGILEITRLLSEAPAAGQLLMVMISAMDKSNAIVASHAILSELTGRSVSTVRRAIPQLEERNLIEVVHLQDRGSANLYKIHERIAWCGKGAAKRAAQSARVLVRSQDQPEPDKLGKQPPLVQMDFDALRDMTEALTPAEARAMRPEEPGEQIELEDWITRNG